MVVTHTGCGLPYQLHCCTQDCRLEEDTLVVTEDDERDDAVGTDDGVEEVAPEQTAPLIVGISAAAPFLFI